MKEYKKLSPFFIIFRKKGAHLCVDPTAPDAAAATRAFCLQPSGNCSAPHLTMKSKTEGTSKL